MAEVNRLEVSDISKWFGGVHAVSDVSFSARDGVIKAIIGPNGAGKTTLINLLTGFLQVDSGSIHFNDRPINGLRPHKIVSLGISRTFQTVDVFEGMTVLENVMLGSYSLSSTSAFSHAFLFPGARKEEKNFRARAMEFLHFVGLDEIANMEANSTSYGDQKKIVLARALTSNPKLLFLDEPVAGLNETETEKIADILREIKKQGVGIILVEHDMRLVMGIADEILVVNFGTKLCEGAPEEVRNNAEVIKAYLGT
jgi:branched-chain amino acid transport system ATP-binding protein